MTQQRDLGGSREAQGLMHDGGAGTSLVARDADPGQFGSVRRGSRPAWKNSGDVGAAATVLGKDAGSAVAGDGPTRAAGLGWRGSSPRGVGVFVHGSTGAELRHHQDFATPEEGT